MEKKMKVAVVTGGARGIGKAIVEKLSSMKVDTAIWDLTEDGKMTATEIGEKYGTKNRFYRVDVSHNEEVTNSAKKTLEDYEKVDIVINNAGITRDGLLMRMKPENWYAVIDVNLSGCFHCTKAFLKQMTAQRWGRIINISSVVGITGNFGQTNYSASKAGIIGFTKSIAKEVAKRNITANIIAPGFIETEMTASLPDEVKEKYMKQIPIQRIGKPADIANLVGFLITEEASYITGQVINVDGGLVM
jgi:3-oxoacyl-[acyl-carrier protein] reductase